MSITNLGQPVGEISAPSLVVTLIGAIGWRRRPIAATLLQIVALLLALLLLQGRHAVAKVPQDARPRL